MPNAMNISRSLYWYLKSLFVKLPNKKKASFNLNNCLGVWIFRVMCVGDVVDPVNCIGKLFSWVYEWKKAWYLIISMNSSKRMNEILQSHRHTKNSSRPFVTRGKLNLLPHTHTMTILPWNWKRFTNCTAIWSCEIVKCHANWFSNGSKNVSESLEARL